MGTKKVHSMEKPPFEPSMAKKEKTMALTKKVEIHGGSLLLNAAAETMVKIPFKVNKPQIQAI